MKPCGQAKPTCERCRFRRRTGTTGTSLLVCTACSWDQVARALYATAFSFFKRTNKLQIPIAVPKGKPTEGMARIDATIVRVLPQRWKFNRPIAAANPNSTPVQLEI